MDPLFTKNVAWHVFHLRYSFVLMICWPLISLIRERGIKPKLSELFAQMCRIKQGMALWIGLTTSLLIMKCHQSHHVFLKNKLVFRTSLWFSKCPTLAIYHDKTTCFIIMTYRDISWIFMTFHQLFQWGVTIAGTYNCIIYIVTCQGGRVSSKTRCRSADKTRSLNPLVYSVHTLHAWNTPSGPLT